MQLTLESLADEGVGPAPGALRDRPVDLVHLAHYTMGDRVLEQEVLALFRRQSHLCLQRLREAAGDRAWRDALHTLKGSARGIGAWRILDAVEAAAQLAGVGDDEPRRALEAMLAARIVEASAFIDDMLGDRPASAG